MLRNKTARVVSLLVLACLVLAINGPSQPDRRRWIERTEHEANVPRQNRPPEEFEGFGQYGRGGFGGDGGRGGGRGDGRGGGREGFRGGDSQGRNAFLGFDVDRARNFRHIHGILAGITFVFVFPLGAVIMRVVPGRFTVWIHAATQVIGYAAFIAAAGLGIYLTQYVRIPGRDGTLLTDSAVNHHPIIGLLVLGALFLQPLLGIIHHMRFKKTRTRQIWSHLHIWNGRVAVTLGIINGGLGLRLANASRSLQISYGIVAAVVWLIWMLVALLTEIRRAREERRLRQKRMIQ